MITAIIWFLILIYIILEVCSGGVNLFSSEVKVVAQCEDFQGNTYRVRSKVDGYFKTEEKIKKQLEDEFYRRKGIRLKNVKLIQVV